MNNTTIKNQIISALGHPEAEDGLYLENLTAIHEEESRPVVEGNQLQILDALKELIEENIVESSDSSERVIFSLKS